MKPPPIHAPFDSNGVPSREWVQWANEAYQTIRKTHGFGATTDRPTNGMLAGDMYFDTTLGQPIWWDATAEEWVDATGAAA